MCGIIVDRHVHKNGGTSVRHMFVHAPECRYFGYGLTDESWKVALHHVNQSHARKNWACVEAHYPVLTNLVERVLLAKRTLAPCKSILALRVRDPVEMYFSYYKWDVIGRQKRKIYATGINFTDWIPNNLQTNILVDSRRSDHAQTSRHAFESSVSARDWAAATDLVHKADIVATTENFEVFVDKLNAATGLKLSSSWIVPKHRSMPSQVQSNLEFCKDLSACRSAVLERSADDQRLYKMAVDRMSSMEAQ